MTRRILGISLAVGLALGGAGPAATAEEPQADPDAVDISAYAAELVAAHDEKGHILLVTRTSKHGTNVFFGDGKVFYQQRVYSSSSNASTGDLSRMFWSPRVDGKGGMERRGGKWILRCGSRETELTEFAKEDTDKLVKTASFRKALWKRTAHALARDDRGNYYYVDRLKDEFGGKGHRLYKGPKGAMKEMPMTNIVADSVGEIYSTKKGELRFIIEKKQSQWISGKKRIELTLVPPIQNVILIYSELGVYLGPLGTPCDDL